MAKKNKQVEKIKVLVVFRDGGKEDADVFIQDGGVACIFNNGCGNIKTEYHEDRIEKKLTVKSFNNLWDKLSEGEKYVHDWPKDKEEVDDEMIQDAMEWLYLATNKYEYDVEKIEDKDFTKKELVEKINSILVLE